MKISTKGRYALRLMMDLAMHGETENVTVKEIAERQDISVKYLEQLMSILCKADLVRSERGPQGGYKLTRPPEEYTAGTILRLMEKSMAPSVCVSETHICERAGRCASMILWKKLDDAVNDVLDETTLDDMARWESILCSQQRQPAFDAKALFEEGYITPSICSTAKKE
jgi:Rrf2 family protein